mmetsp:Transcript_3426/g.5810  ORF Transcript_3426/g.5810 Transcript_3426/m.5810 type:complete len:148 (+) Transcript_3426:1022-1465(+)
MHSHNIAHRDIKLQNILIRESDMQLQLIDFGFAVEVEPGQLFNERKGSPLFMAPEIVMKTTYPPFPPDIYSAGVILYALTVGRFPYEGQSAQELFKKVQKWDVNLPYFLSYELCEILSEMMFRHYDYRPSAEEVCSNIEDIIRYQAK